MVQIISMKRQFLSALFIFLAFSVFAQEKKTLSIEDVSINPSLYPRGLSQLSWLNDRDAYAYAEGSALKIFDAESGNEQESIALDALNELLEKGGYEELKRLPSIQWENDKRISFQHGRQVFSADRELSKLKLEFELAEGAANLEYNLKGEANYSYTMENKLYVNGAEVGAGSEDVVFGQAVHRYEFGIGKGTFWSPDGQQVAFYRNDQSGVADYPMLSVREPIVQPYDVKYPMAGTENELVNVGVYHTEKKRVVYLETGDEDQYLTNISWDPNGKYVYVAVLNRGQDHLKWQQFDVSNGKLRRTLFEEKSETFVEPLDPLYFIPGNPNEFLWISWRDGFHHIYRFNTQGELLKQLTKGDYEITGLIGFSGDGKKVFFTSTKESPLEQRIYCVSTKGGGIREVSEGKGQHSGMVSPSGAYLIDRYSNPEVPTRIQLCSEKGKVVRVLKTATNPLDEYEQNTIELGSFEANGNELYYRIIKPYNFDPAKKYPVIQYVYGGPHAQMVRESWMGGASMFLHYMAQQGYVVFTVDNRGSDNRGAAFEQCTHRQLGTLEIEDQLSGLDFIKSKDYVDTARVGVHGWSYGGFMTTSLMLRTPNAFKVGVCGGPVINWAYYEIMYTERYMDTPEENPDGYDKNNLLNYVNNLKGRLLIVHGADDDVVLWQHSLAFVDKCVDEGVLFDYFVYPGHKHHVRGVDRVHLQKYMADYFIRNL